ncbi:hypothetical protein OGM63_16575 [Plectonema radiosum NIES-515]|uniref:Uncharacterized protein n=1 Tax=Plectonema radiosum NIES-515 TaxID=2986073 RepID=A0ABT3B169_9CYAN|nr:hypothetical protein [Plectonema radiosum]MCV3215108.1 hypothetical protein [Plectonema radiosum NIES-515]
MSDNYIERQLKFYEAATTEEAQDNALYRIGTYLEVSPCDGKANFTPEQREIILDAAKCKGDNNE